MGTLAKFFALFWGWADYTRRIGRTPRISENIPRGVQARFRIEAPRLELSPGTVAALGEGQKPKAPAVKREAEEWGWGR